MSFTDEDRLVILSMSPEQRDWFLTRLSEPLQHSFLRHVAGGHVDVPAQQPAPTPPQASEEQGPFPLGTFPPGSYPAQQQRLYENLPKPLKEAYRKEANGQGPMSSDEKNAYDHLADIFSRVEMTNTWIEMVMEHRPGKKRDNELEAWRAQLADQMKEWEDFAKEPVKVLGSGPWLRFLIPVARSTCGSIQIAVAVTRFSVHL